MDPGVVQRHINGQRTKNDIQMSKDIVLVKIEDTCRSNNSEKTHKNYICSQEDKYETASDTWRYETNKNKVEK